NNLILREPVNDNITVDKNGVEQFKLVFTFTSQSSIDAFLNIRTISCFEAPRKNLYPLSSSSDSGSVDIYSLQNGQPIYTTGQHEYASIGGLAKGIKVAETKGRKCLLNMFDFARVKTTNNYYVYGNSFAGIN